jgi:hypothetical protein
VRVRRACPLATLAAVALACAPGAASAAAPRLEARAEPAEIRIGDPIRLRLSLTVPDDSDLVLPQLAGTLGDFEVLAWGALTPRKAEGGGRLLIAEGTLTAWMTGDLTIPAVAAVSADSAAAPSDVRSDPIAVHVVSVGVEENADLRPLKGPVSLPREWGWLIALAAASAALVALALWLARRLRRRPAAARPATPVDPRPAHEIALAEIERLERDRLVAQGRLSEHFMRLTEIMRRYFEGRFGIPSIDMTTGETLAALRAALGSGRVALDLLDESRSLLEEADLVKFAEYVPPREAALAALDRTRAVVRATSVPAPATDAAPAQPAAAGAA